MAIKTIIHSERGAHLATYTQDAPPHHWASPVCLVVETKTGDQRSSECDNGSDDARRQAHLGLSDTVVLSRIIVGDAIGSWSTQVGTEQRADKW